MAGRTEPNGMLTKRTCMAAIPRRRHTARGSLSRHRSAAGRIPSVKAQVTLAMNGDPKARKPPRAEMNALFGDERSLDDDLDWDARVRHRIGAGAGFGRVRLVVVLPAEALDLTALD